MNKVILLGNMTRDVEIRHTNGNATVANFGMAINRRYKTAAGEDREETLFIDAEAWGKTGENISRFFAKGSRILVEGRIKMDEWEAKDGGKRTKHKVSVDRFEFIDRREGGGNSGQSSGGHRDIQSEEAPF